MSETGIIFKKRQFRFVLGGLIILAAIGLIYGVSYFFGDPWDTERINILFLGFDRTADRDEYYHLYLPDTIMLANIDFNKNRVNVFSIPRDATVKIAHHGSEDIIQNAYYIGHEYGSGTNKDSRHREGIRYALDTAGNLVDESIDYHVTLDMDGIVEVVDMMGGVYYNVEEEIREGLGLGRVLLKPGEQNLDGKGFFYYIHYRDLSPSTDIERIQRQQNILSVAFQQFKNNNKLSELPGIIRKMNENLDTDLSFRQLVSLADFAGDLNEEGIDFFSFTGEYRYDKHGVPYLILNQEKTQEVLKYLHN